MCTRASSCMSNMPPVRELVILLYRQVLRMMFVPAKTTLAEHLDRSAMYDSSAGVVGLVYITCVRQGLDI